jgi:hypothetical protein
LLRPYIAVHFYYQRVLIILIHSLPSLLLQHGLQCAIRPSTSTTNPSAAPWATLLPAATAWLTSSQRACRRQAAASPPASCGMQCALRRAAPARLRWKRCFGCQAVSLWWRGALKVGKKSSRWQEQLHSLGAAAQPLRPPPP